MLLYLEAQAMGRVDKYDFDINLNEVRGGIGGWVDEGGVGAGLGG